MINYELRIKNDILQEKSYTFALRIIKVYQYLWTEQNGVRLEN
jgi:hypothetical protein